MRDQRGGPHQEVGAAQHGPLGLVVEQVAELPIDRVFPIGLAVRAELVHHLHLLTGGQVQPYELHVAVLHGEDGFVAGLLHGGEPRRDGLLQLAEAADGTLGHLHFHEHLVLGDRRDGADAAHIAGTLHGGDTRTRGGHGQGGHRTTGAGQIVQARAVVVRRQLPGRTAQVDRGAGHVVGLALVVLDVAQAAQDAVRATHVGACAQRVADLEGGRGGQGHPDELGLVVGEGERCALGLDGGGAEPFGQIELQLREAREVALVHMHGHAHFTAGSHGGGHVLRDADIGQEEQVE